MKTLSTLLGASAVAVAATSAFAGDPELLVFDYSGYEEPSFHTIYNAQHGVDPSFTFFGDEDEALQKLLSGFKTDVAHICGDSVTLWESSGIIEPWDTAKITAYDDLDTNLTGTDIATDEAYFIPSDFGSTAIAYNTEEVPAEDVASLDVFLNPKYAGRITLPDNVADAYALGYLATGVDDWSNITDEQFQAASDWLRKAHANLRTYWVDPGELAQLLGSGEVLISWAWNETYPAMVSEGYPIAFQRETVEGSSLWLCGYVNLKDAPGSEQKAYDYLNSFLDPVNAENLMAWGYGLANTKGMETLTEEERIAGGLGDVSVPLLAQLPISIEMRERHAEEFEKIKAGF